MFVILTYDVGAKRNSKVLKICRRYLIHVQKSVFEGYLTDKQLCNIKSGLQKIIAPDNDQVAIYKLAQRGVSEKEIIGYYISQDNIV